MCCLEDGGGCSGRWLGILGEKMVGIEGHFLDIGEWTQVMGVYLILSNYVYFLLILSRSSITLYCHLT